MTAIADVPLAGGTTIPQLGFGVFQIPPKQTQAAVEEALAAGYRSIDTATAYRNEAEVGRAVEVSGLDRSEVFVTTKLWNSDHAAGRAREAFEASLERLGTDRVDLYLIHWPLPARELYVDAWLELEQILDDGLASAIGVSNFHRHHLEQVLEAGSVVPAVNQVELHPALAQAELREFHARHGIVTEAWSPLAQADVLDDEVITAIAAEHGATPAQVVLAWHLALGNVVIPKTVDPDRMRENLGAVGVSLDDEDMSRIAALDSGGRRGPDPEEFDLT